MLHEIHSYYFDVLPSTNSWLKSQAASLPLSTLSVVRAGGQSEGRGRFDRKWLSPNGLNLYISFAFRVKASLPSAHQLGLLIAISTSELLEELGLHVQIKWPNDLVIEGKKLGGILVEAVALEAGAVYVMGIGLNINAEQEHLPTDRLAASLFLETGKKESVEAVAAALVQKVFHRVNRYFSEGFHSFYPTFCQKMAFQAGQHLCFSVDNKQITGIVAGYTPDGALILKQGLKERLYFTGEIL